MEADLKELMDASPVTGLATAFTRDGSVSVSYWGELEGQALSPKTIWPVASLTKPVFACAVLKLVDQGVLDLDQPLQRYLPCSDVDCAGDISKMTARHVLIHTTGFPNWRDARGLRAEFRPGSRFSYSSEGINYLQRVVEHMLGAPADAIIRQVVFDPYGMDGSELRPETEASLPPALAFLAADQPASAALSLWTTSGDYARFLSAMLGEAELRRMVTPQSAVGHVPDLYWGLGWGLQGQGSERSFWHWGARGMPRTMNFAVGWPQSHEAAVIFTNHADGLYLCRDILTRRFPHRAFPAFDWLLPAQNWRADGTGSRA